MKSKGKRNRLTQAERDLLDQALFDIYRVAWQTGHEPQYPLLRAAYLQGCVDQANRKPSKTVPPTTRKEALT